MGALLWRNDMNDCKILIGDCIEMMRTLPEQSVNCCVTSPPYFGLRCYFPDAVKPKADCPEWVINKISSLGVLPVDHISQ
jgi:DNA modification methylase